MKNPLECGHHESFAIFSSEEPEKLLFCELCDMRQQRNDLLTDIDDLKQKYEHEIYMIRADKAQTLIDAEKAMAQIREAGHALRADAERYRWLRSEAYVDQLEYNSWYWGTGVRAKEGRESPDDFDAAIDAVRKP